jgi:hypothetical protein
MGKSVDGLGLQGGGGGDVVLNLGVLLKADLEGNQGVVGKSVEGLAVGPCMASSEASSGKKQKGSMARRQLRKIKAFLTKSRKEERDMHGKGIVNEHLQGLSGKTSV